MRKLVGTYMRSAAPINSSAIGFAISCSPSMQAFVDRVHVQAELVVHEFKERASSRVGSATCPEPSGSSSRAVENPPDGVRIVEVPDIRRRDM